MENSMMWTRPSSPIRSPIGAATGGDIASPEPCCSPDMLSVRSKSSNRSEGRSTQSAGRSTLSDGDAVVFRKGGSLYGVSQVTGEFSDAPGFFMLVPLQDSEDSMDPSAQLLVLQQDKWIGFKSVAAGGRFLQARRRGPDHLCFYNTNWGTWEQWELVGDEPKEDWTRWTFHFRSRRLENFVFAVEVERLDSTTVSASMAHGQVQRLVKAVQENVDEKQGNVLHAMANLLTSEWKHFMQREMQARKALQKELSGLRQELLDVRESALSYIGKLNSDTEATVTYLMDHIAAKEDEVQQLDESVAATCTKRWAHQERLADALALRKERFLLRDACTGWLDICSRKRELARLETQCRDWCRRRKTKALFGAWQQVWLRRKAEAEVRRRVKSLTMANALRSWQHWARERGRVKKMVVEQRRRAESRIVRWVISRWRGVLDDSEERGVQLLDTWKVGVARQAVARWREFVASQQRKRLTEMRLRKRRQLCLLRATFRAWREKTALEKEGRGRLWHLKRACKRRRLAAVFSAWRAEVDHGVNRSKESEGLFRKKQVTQKGAVFKAWQGVVYECRLRQRYAEEMQQEGESRLLSRGFEAWVLSVHQQRQSVLAASRLERAARQRLLRERFKRWRLGVLASKERQRVAELLERKADRRTLVDSLYAWQAFVRKKKDARDLRAGLSRRWAARCAVLAFDSWQGYVADRRRKREGLRTAESSSKRKVLARTISAWLEYSQLRKAKAETIVAASRTIGRNSLRRAFLGWQSVLEERRCTEGEEERCLRFAVRWARKGALEKGFRLWKAFVAAAQERRLEESHHAIEELLKEERADAWAKQQVLKAAFSAWRDGGFEALEERKAAEEREKERKSKEQLEQSAKEALAGRWALRRRLERAFRMWREKREGARIDRLAAEIAIVEEQQEREKLEAERLKFAERWAKKRLQKKGFRAWEEACDETRKMDEEKRRKEEQERKLEARAEKWAMKRQLERAWKVWRSEVAVSKEEAFGEAELETRREARAEHWAKHRLLERAFTSWVDIVEEAEEAKRVQLEEERRQRERSESAEKRAATWAAKRLLENVFIGWRGMVRVAKVECLVEKEAESRAGVWAMRRMLERVFSAWKRGVEGIVEARKEDEKRETVLRLVAEQRVMRRALLAWEDLTAAAKELRISEANARKEVMRSVFQEWRHASMLRQRALSEIKKRQQLSCLRGAFSSWVGTVEKSQVAATKAAELRQDNQQQLLTTAFFAWRARAFEGAAQQRQLRKLRESRQLATAVRAWRQLAAAKRVRRLAKQRVEGKVRKRRLREAFWAWEDVVAQEMQTRGELGACITRKRMAKRWFMQWYWDAFDNEIHRSMVDIVSSTQRSLNEVERAAPAVRSNGHTSLAAPSNGHVPLLARPNAYASLASQSSTGQAKSNNRAPLAVQSNGHSFERNVGTLGRSSAENWRALVTHRLGLDRPRTSPARASGVEEGAQGFRTEGGNRKGEKESLSVKAPVVMQSTREADTCSPSFSKQIEAILGAPIRRCTQGQPNVERLFGESLKIPSRGFQRPGT